MAEDLGLSTAFALDLTETDAQGRKWDLSDRATQDRALQEQDTKKPWLLIACPPCKMFSSLQNLSLTQRDEDEYKLQLQEAVEHLAFSVLMCLRQEAAGRKYLFEHPAAAKSFGTRIVQKLLTEGRGRRINFDFCQAGMTLKVGNRQVPVKKRTGIISNSAMLLDTLSKLNCRGLHVHAQLLGAEPLSARCTQTSSAN